MILSVIVQTQAIAPRNTPAQIASIAITATATLIRMEQRYFLTGLFCFGITATCFSEPSVIFIPADDGIVGIGSDLIHNTIENTENNDCNQGYHQGQYRILQIEYGQQFLHDRKCKCCIQFAKMAPVIIITFGKPCCRLAAQNHTRKWQRHSRVWFLR